jgi:prepilin-type N-terminal cleavage/methylation domain-containing protein
MRLLRTGFTLIETMIALSIVLVLISVSISRYVQYNQRQAARATIDRVRQVFEQAKANAISGKKDCVTCGGANQKCDSIVEVPADRVLNGWRVQIVYGAPFRYTLDGLCGGVSFLSKTENFPANITFNGSCGSVTFNTTGGTNLAPASCFVRAVGGGTTYTVTLTRDGTVN